MSVSRVINSFYTSCSYVIDGTCVVDCGDVSDLLLLLDERQLKAVFLTHGHFDHIYGLNDLCRVFPDALVYCSEWTRRQLLDAKLNISFYHESPFVFDFPERIIVVTDREKIDLGNGLTITAVYTPGHTPGCITWMTEDALFTGDAFIPGVKVVTKLPHGNKLQAAQSLTLIHSLSTNKTVYPGHSDSKTTL